jgi:hypothetical protein
MRQPQQARYAEAEFKVSSEVVVVQWFVEPISISEDNAAHFKSNIYKSSNNIWSTAIIASVFGSYWFTIKKIVNKASFYPTELLSE